MSETRESPEEVIKRALAVIDALRKKSRDTRFRLELFRLKRIEQRAEQVKALLEGIEVPKIEEEKKPRPGAPMIIASITLTPDDGAAPTRLTLSAKVTGGEPAPSLQLIIFEGGVATREAFFEAVPVGDPRSLDLDIPDPGEYDLSFQAKASSPAGSAAPPIAPRRLSLRKREVALAKGRISLFELSLTRAEEGELVRITARGRNEGGQRGTFRLHGIARGPCVQQEGFTPEVDLEPGNEIPFSTSISMHPCTHDQTVEIQRKQDTTWVVDDARTQTLTLARERPGRGPTPGAAPAPAPTPTLQEAITQVLDQAFTELIGTAPGTRKSFTSGPFTFTGLRTTDGVAVIPLAGPEVLTLTSVPGVTLDLDELRSLVDWINDLRAGRVRAEDVKWIQSALTGIDGPREEAKARFALEKGKPGLPQVQRPAEKVEFVRGEAARERRGEEQQ